MKNVEVKFPLIEDITMEVAKRYGMIQPGKSSTKAVRAVFVIDPKGVIRAIIYYPLSLGRNLDEFFRVVVALQTADAFAVATPADWRPGDDVIVPTAGSCGVAKERMEAKGGKSVLRLVLLHEEARQGEGAGGHSEEVASPADKARYADAAPAVQRSARHSL